MTGGLVVLVGVAGLLVVLPGLVELALLTVSGVCPSPLRLTHPAPRGFRLAVVIPAHDEAATIARVVRSVREADHRGLALEIVVVADNCTDNTAEVARREGARVLVRSDAACRGKAYALGLAFDAALAKGAEAVLVVDADSEIDRDLLTYTAALIAGGADAVQARYLVRNAAASIRTRLMQVALMAFNVLRPRGRSALGMSAGLSGNGFALSAATLRVVPPRAALSIVEDLEYHLTLVRAGRRVVFLDVAGVRADMPVSSSAAAAQRARWEGGRLRLLREWSPRLLRDVCAGRWRSIEPLLDLLLPPLASFAVVLLGLACWPWAPARLVGAAGLGLLAAHVMAAIAVAGGGRQEWRALAAVPFYVIWKIAQAGRIGRQAAREAAWVRTPREASGGGR